jgi:biopolymer transport protein ExbD
MARRHRQTTDFVEPDLPIVPMLDMSFQLLAFFVVTFHPAPTEGQIAMSLPPEEKGDPTAPSIPDITSQQPVKYIAKVEATNSGQIASIQLTEEGSADTEGKKFGGSAADVRAFLDTCRSLVTAEDQKRAADPNRPPPKLTLEFGSKLLQEYVMQVTDAAKQAGFKEMAPIPLEKEAR